MFKKLYNLFSTESDKIQGHCRICHRPLFHLDTEWGMRGICVYCGQAYQEGKESGVEKYSDNDYGYVWFDSLADLRKVLTNDMLSEGYTPVYDSWFDAYRIHKVARKKGKSFWETH